jgi:hypothetical protein
MNMPKTAVYKDDALQPREHQIWSAGQIATMKAKAIAQGMRDPTNSHFRTSVLAPDPRHAD